VSKVCAISLDGEWHNWLKCWLAKMNNTDGEEELSSISENSL